MKTEILKDVKSFIRKTDTMGYPQILIMRDSEVLCTACAKKNFKSICLAVFTNDVRDSWMPGVVEPFWEGANINCSHCDAEIESAYGDPEQEEEEVDQAHYQSERDLDCP